MEIQLCLFFHLPGSENFSSTLLMKMKGDTMKADTSDALMNFKNRDETHSKSLHDPTQTLTLLDSLRKMSDS